MIDQTSTSWVYIMKNYGLIRNNFEALPYKGTHFIIQVILALYSCIPDTKLKKLNSHHWSDTDQVNQCSLRGVY